MSQESGRAGRDGLRATCLLLYSFADYSRQRSMIEDGIGGAGGGSRGVGGGGAAQTVKDQLAALSAVKDYCDNHVECRRCVPLLCRGDGKGRGGARVE